MLAHLYAPKHAKIQHLQAFLSLTSKTTEVNKVRTYEQSPSYTPSQKIAIALVAPLAIVIILIIGYFVYDFIETYHAWLSHALFYLLSTIGVAVVILIAAFTAYAVSMLWLRVELLITENGYRAQNNALFMATTSQMSSGAVYLSEQRTEAGVTKFKHLPRHAKNKPEPDNSNLIELSQPEIKTTLLSDIRDYQRILLVGGQNSGKTSLLKHIAKQRSGAGSVLILDSHNTAGKWARDYRIVGHGRDYQAIETELKNLVAVMDTRYKELASGKVGERQHELITVVSDEWTTVSKHIQNLNDYLLPLLTESRKVGIDLILATHSQTAESLGLKGKADLKSAFDATLILKNISGERLVELDNGESINVYHHCGQYQDDLISRDFTNKLDYILNNPIEEISIEKKIIAAYWQLKNENKQISLSAICIAVYGYKKGEKIKLIARILAENSLVTTE